MDRRHHSPVSPAAAPSAGAGLADMDARIEYLTALKARLEAQRDSLLPVAIKPSAYFKTLTESIADCERLLNDARGRRYEFQVQQAGQN